MRSYERNFVCLSAACVLWPGIAALGATYIVAPDGSGDFLTIQEATDDAQPGDEILVREGTYVENINFLGKELLVHSETGPGSTIIDGSQGAPGQATCVTFHTGEGPEAVLSGFTVTGGEGTDDSEPDRGGGVLCVFSSATINEC